MLRTTPYTEEDWQAYFDEYADALAPEAKPFFWQCSCGAINATVIGEKAFCKECNSYSFNPKAPRKPVI